VASSRAGTRVAAATLPDSVTALIYLASRKTTEGWVTEAWIATERYTPAIDMLRDAVQKSPDDMDLQFELGSAYERSGDKKSAEDLFLKILDKHPENAATLNYLGYMWADKGINLDRAADMLIALEQARSMALLATMMAVEDDARERRAAISAAKVQIGRSGRLVGQQAIQIHGGIGMTMEAKVGHYFKRVTMIDTATIVTSLPCRFTSATPKGTAPAALSTGPLIPCRRPWSMNTVGLLL